ncbi:MAG: ABC transporter ATP-binding protein [Deltaproteobacteria bacterium CG11_big_fil_rev_8_21_14_0_20_47_16]|nr:MAG: ABC transporter ATP-binding protein [Deltaproteobacteria bacterium CG11_big_fil_rev_8_21_14_0_20_47_16]
MTLLSIRNLHVHYGAIHAIKGISLDVNEGEIVTLIGSNGAGKTTLLRTISGLLRPSQGTIEYNDDGLKPLHRMKSHEIVRCGVVQSPEGRMIFNTLTVEENLLLGAYSQKDAAKIQESREMVFTLFPRLKERRRQVGGTLSGGEQQMLAIGRALMARPKLLLLDEPSLGIAPALVQQIFTTLRQINKRGVTILLVEQDAYLALETANRGYVLETGKIVNEGAAKELIANPAVQQAYLGMA